VNAGSSSSSKRWLTPGLKLAAGETSTQFLQLISPAGAAAAKAAAGLSSSSSSEPLPVLHGPLYFFYKRLLPASEQLHKVQLPVLAPLPRIDSMDRGQQQQQQQQQVVEASVPLPSVVAEPPVDLLVVWQFEQRPGGSRSTVTAAAAAAGPQQQQQGGVIRAGLISVL